MPHPVLPVEQQIVAAIRKIIREVDLHSRRLHDSCGLTGPQLATLQEVERLQPVSPSVLARAVHLSAPTMTGILHRLQRHGLLSRQPSETDRRAVLVSLTADGTEVLAKAPSLLQDRFRRELSRLQGWEQHMCLSVLERVAALMGADDLEAAPHLQTGVQLAGPEDGPDPPEALVPARDSDPEPAR